MSRTVRASSFADPADVAAFRACKKRGNSDRYCFGIGDPGIGFMENDVADDSIPWVALPRNVWQARWGSKGVAYKRRVRVVHDGREAICLLGDTMPSESSITNGRGIDLAPGAMKLLGLKPPVDAVVIWSWVDDDEPAPPLPAPRWVAWISRLFGRP